MVNQRPARLGGKALIPEFLFEPESYFHLTRIEQVLQDEPPHEFTRLGEVGWPKAQSRVFPCVVHETRNRCFVVAERPRSPIGDVVHDRRVSIQFVEYADVSRRQCHEREPRCL